MSGAGEKTLRVALQTIHKRALGESSDSYMSIPADPKRDADLLLAGAIDELMALRDLLSCAREYICSDHCGTRHVPICGDIRKAMEGCP